MRTRYFALIFGIVYLLVGLAGFVPTLMTQPSGAPPLVVSSFYGYLLGLFPVNLLHTLVHIALGLWGVLVWRSFTASRGYARSLTVIFIVLAVLGLIPGLSTLFGLVPLFGHDVWLHGLTALVAAYFGWVAAPRPATATTTIRR